MWDSLDKAWQACFELSWEAYCSGSFPIGAVIVDESSNIIATGRNMVYEQINKENCISYNNLAHAEMNALMKINRHEHPNVRKYTLYAIMEPCPLCFGALVMANIRNLKFAARDRYAGGTNLKDKNEYISRKQIKIEGPFKDIEKIHIAMQTEFELSRLGTGAERLLAAWSIDCPDGVALGCEMFETGMLRRAKRDGRPISQIINETHGMPSSIQMAVS